MRRRRGCGCLTGLLTLIIVVALYLGFDYGSDALVYAPWAYGIFGRATLTGAWNGALTTPSGAQYAVYLQLNRSQSSRGSFLHSSRTGRAYIDGHISWCARGVPSTTYAFSGTANRSASIVRMEAQSPPHPRAGLLPFTFQGAWHGSTLVLQARFRRYNGHAFVYTSTNPDDTRAVGITLHKNGHDAYLAACAHT